MKCQNLIVILMLAATVPLFAVDESEHSGTDVNLARGIAPTTTFRSFGIDTVNEFNGNLMLRIPIGSSYPVGPTLNQNLILVYNSNLYDYEYLHYFNPDTTYKETKRRVLPERVSNAGLGWSLDLGRLLPPSAQPMRLLWAYRAPDGSLHEFDTERSFVSYTHDGSFLRMQRYPQSGSIPEYREITFPDGTVHQFDSDNRLKKISDRLNHWITVDYGTLAWTIKNGYGTTEFRATTVNFKEYDTATQPNHKQVVASVVVPAFGSATATAEYKFSYTMREIARAGCADPIPEDATHFAAPQLTEILFPDGSKYQPVYPEHAPDCSLAMITSLKLPTLGSVAWEYGTYNLPMAKCNGDDMSWLMPTLGVVRRTLIDKGSVPVAEWNYVSDVTEGTDATMVDCGPRGGVPQPAGHPPTLVTTTVSRKERINGNLVSVGGSTVTYFSGLRNVLRADAIGYKAAEYGLPFTRDIAEGCRFLSVEKRDSNDTPLEKTYVTYESDAQDFSGSLSNPRVKGQLTLHSADTGCFGVCRSDVTNSNYDGYGHFRQSVSTSNFGPTRTTFTNHQPRPDTWILGVYDSAWTEENGKATKQSFTFDTNGFMSTRRSYAGVAATASAITADNRKDLLEAWCRDARGFLTSEKFFGGDGITEDMPASNLCSAAVNATEYQIDHQYTFEESVPVKHTARHFGMPFYSTDETFDAQTGLVSASRELSGVPVGNGPAKPGPETKYVYDTLGRLTEYTPPGQLNGVTPEGRAWVLYEYTKASGTAPAKLTVSTRAPGKSATDTALTKAVVYYDDFGRPVQEKRSMPSNSEKPWSRTSTTFDALGRTSSVSMAEGSSVEAYENVSPQHTSTREYDALGRVTKVTAADGEKIVFAYSGSREKRSTRRVATLVDQDPETEVETVERFDQFGRLKELVENSGPTDAASATSRIGAAVTTQYTYDGADRLTKVEMVGSGSVQNRTFEYDGRGFLTWESHPEPGVARYTYDARGNVLSKSHGSATSLFDLKYGYDRAGRLVRVEGRNPFHDPEDPDQPEFRVLKTFEFATDDDLTSTPTNLRRGKLLKATRYNYSTTPFESEGSYLEATYTVSEAYSYKDLAGRKTDRNTVIRRCCGWGEPDGWVTVQDISQRVAYDALDQPISVSYPVCVGCGTPPDHPERNLAPTYDQGLTTSIPGFVSELSYWPDGTRNEIVHSNGIVDSHTRDPDLLPRPSSISSGLYNVCRPPIITDQPEGKTYTPGPQEQPVTLSVTVGTGATLPLSYKWYANGTEIPGMTDSTLEAEPLVTTNYNVEVKNACRSVWSQTATVTVICVPPELGDLAAYRNVNGTWTLEVSDASGTEPLTFAWTRVSDGVLVGSERTITLQVPKTTEYRLQVTNNCPGSAAKTIKITLPLTMDAYGLRAIRDATENRVDVEWPASPGAALYFIERREHGSGWVQVGQSTVPRYTDSTVVAGKVYFYRASALDENGESQSPYSNADVAGTMAFPAIIAGAPITAASFNQMLDAINAARSAIDLLSLTWSTVVPSSVPAPSPGGQHDATLITACRQRMNEVLAAAGAIPGGYTDADLNGLAIRAVHIAEIQERLR